MPSALHAFPWTPRVRRQCVAIMRAWTMHIGGASSPQLVRASSMNFRLMSRKWSGFSVCFSWIGCISLSMVESISRGMKRAANATIADKKAHICASEVMLLSFSAKDGPWNRLIATMFSKYIRILFVRVSNTLHEA